MILQAVANDYVPHPEGIWPAVCVDVIDLGEQATEYQGQKRMVHKVRLVFESESITQDGRRMTVSRTFSASLHSKAKLAEFLGKWRGRPVVPGETIDLDKLLGASCTLVVSHQQGKNGVDIYAHIDAISKPTKKVSPSGQYDAKAARERLREFANRDAQHPGQRSTTPARPAAPAPVAEPAMVDDEIPF